MYLKLRIRGKSFDFTKSAFGVLHIKISNRCSSRTLVTSVSRFEERAGDADAVPHSLPQRPIWTQRLSRRGDDTARLLPVQRPTSEVVQAAGPGTLRPVNRSLLFALDRPKYKKRQSIAADIVTYDDMQPASVLQMFAIELCMTLTFDFKIGRDET